MAIVYPTLNGNGYARDIGTICDEVFAATIYSRTRYSELYYGKVASLDTLMKDYNNKPELLAEAVEDVHRPLYPRVWRLRQRAGDVFGGRRFQHRYLHHRVGNYG